MTRPRRCWEARLKRRGQPGAASRRKQGDVRVDPPLSVNDLPECVSPLPELAHPLPTELA
jgi:hypothetical protein